MDRNGPLCIQREIWTDSWGQCSSDGPRGGMYLQEDLNMAAVLSGTSLRGRRCQTVPNTGLMGLLEERGE